MCWSAFVTTASKREELIINLILRLFIMTNMQWLNAPSQLVNSLFSNTVYTYVYVWYNWYPENIRLYNISDDVRGIIVNYSILQRNEHTFFPFKSFLRYARDLLKPIVPIQQRDLYNWFLAADCRQTRKKGESWILRNIIFPYQED